MQEWPLAPQPLVIGEPPRAVLAVDPRRVEQLHHQPPARPQRPRRLGPQRRVLPLLGFRRQPLDRLFRRLVVDQELVRGVKAVIVRRTRAILVAHEPEPDLLPASRQVGEVDLGHPVPAAGARERPTPGQVVAVDTVDGAVVAVDEAGHPLSERDRIRSLGL